MAGTIRQSLDSEALTKYLDENVQIIKTPVVIKQALPQNDLHISFHG